MIILGISAFYHDSAACLVVNGKILAAAQEERFTRVKHDQSFPQNAIKYCIAESGLGANDIDYVVFYDKPFLKFDRLFETVLAFAPAGLKSFIRVMPLWLHDKLFQKKIILSKLNEFLGRREWGEKLLFSDHHLSHLASAFFPSPFEEAAVLTMDGVGEWVTTSLAIGRGSKLEVLKEINFPHSLGLLYSAFTYYLGFKVNSGEYKVMGLAPYGQPIYSDLIKNYLIEVKNDGSYKLDMSYFGFCTSTVMTNKKFHKLFGGEPRIPEETLTQREMNIAASIQKVLEDVVLKIAISIKKETGQKNLCLAGGVALNCVVNGKIVEEGIFENVWIQPASGDAGGALGAALAVYYLMLENPRYLNPNDDMNGGYLGPSYSQSEIETRLLAAGANFLTLDDKDLIDKVVNELAEGKAIGWHQGRMEFGPRALGSRSIIADPRSPLVQKQLNLKIKYRESFRPFAPSVMEEYVDEWFTIKQKSPYMLLVGNVSPVKLISLSSSDQVLNGLDKLNLQRSLIPAVTHVDNSSRIQTVSKVTNNKFWDLLNKFHEFTKCPVLVNTSFNIRGEPIVCTPEDSFKCFMGTEIEVLVVGNCFLTKDNQDPLLKLSYLESHDLD